MDAYMVALAEAIHPSEAVRRASKARHVQARAAGTAPQVRRRGAAEAAGATSKLFQSSQQCTGGRVFLFMSAGSRQAIASCGQVAHAYMPL